MTKINSKQCSKCREVKPVEEFHKHKTGKDGIRAVCKTCEAARFKGYATTFDGKCRLAFRKSKATARKYGVVDTLTIEDVRHVFSADHCDYCDKKLKQAEKTLEHILPFEQNGSNTFGNITLACADCNRRKNAYPAFEFMLLNSSPEPARRLLNTLAERNGVTPTEYLYRLARAGLEYRTTRLYRIAGVER